MNWCEWKKVDPSRSRMNFFTFLVTCLTLFVAVKVTDGGGGGGRGFANSIDKITRNLDVALEDLRKDMPVYANYTERRVYVSKTSFNPKGMSGLYNLTRKFMDFVLDPDFLMKDLIKFDVNDDFIVNTNVPIADILRNYWGLLLLLFILIVTTLFLPLCGLCFCCCRCCGNCGARSQPCDKKRDLCKKVLQGALLIALGTALLFCVVCAFASNQQLQEGINEFPDNIRNSKRDVNTFLDSTKDQARNLLVTNYRDFSKVFNKTINTSGEQVMQQLTIWSNATAMMELNKFVLNIPTINMSLQNLKEDTNSLRASASQLNDAMRKVKRDLLNTLEKCHLSDCDKIKNNITQLQTNIDFNKLPDVSPTINKLNELKLDDLERAANEGTKMLNSIESKIQSQLSATMKEAVDQVNEAGKTITQNLNNITKIITDFQNSVNKSVDPVISDMNYYLSNYSQYRYYGGLAVSCVLLIITICIALGLVCGICGKRPDGYSDNCCNKGAGSQFLICSVMIMFIFGVVIGVITIVTLLLGVTSDRVACYPLRHPADSMEINVIDEFLAKNSKRSSLNVSLKDVLERCYRNQSIYHVFNLKSQFDIDTLVEKFDVSQYLDGMYKTMDNILKGDVTILSQENEDILKNLSNFDPSINFDQFPQELKPNFINLSLKEISKELQQVVNQIDDSELMQTVKTELKLSILHINTYDEKLLVPMKELAEKVMNNAQNLEDDLNMNSTDFSTAIKKLISEIKDAQEVLTNNGTDMLKDAALAFGDIVKNQVNSYLYRVGNITKGELGQCGPLSMAINATLTATCDKIILPWNGFWVSLMLSLLLFVPTIIVSVKLASLYQKYKQYGQYVETEYLYDAYADRGDHIPLNSRNGKRGRKKKTKKGKKYEDRPQNMGGEVVAREYAAGSHPPDTRYADMAPKHWEEFPNGGPPQYQRAPTEYERPPPYYYPGSGDQ